MIEVNSAGNAQRPICATCYYGTHICTHVHNTVPLVQYLEDACKYVGKQLGYERDNVQ